MRSPLLISLALSLSSIVVLGLWWSLRDDRPPASPMERTLRYVLTVRNESGDVVRDAEVRMFAPAELGAVQSLIALDVSAPHEVEHDAIGNTVLHLPLAPLAPWASRVVRIEARLRLAGDARRFDWGEGDAVLADAPSLEVSDRDVRARATQLKDGGLDAIVSWVAAHMTPEPYVVRDLGARHALATGRGDCTEYMFLTAALARASGIPTRQVAGFVVAGDRSVVAEGYHNWLYAEQRGRWTLVDPLAARLDEGYGNYVVFRVLDPAAGATLSTSQRFFSHDPRLAVRLSGV